MVSAPWYDNRLLGGFCVCLFPFLFLLFMVGGLVLREVCAFLKTQKPTLLSAAGMVFFEAVLTVLLARVFIQALDLDIFTANPLQIIEWLPLLGALGFGMVVTMFAAAALFTGTLEQVSYGKALAIYWLHLFVLLAILAFAQTLIIGVGMVFS